MYKCVPYTCVFICFYVYGDLCVCGRRYLWISICVCTNMVWYFHLSKKDHLTCLLRNLYAGQEARVRTLYGTIDWFKIKKGVHQGCPLSSCLFNLHAEHIMRNAGLDEFQAGVKIGRRNINNLRYAYDTTPMAESKEELKSLLVRLKESERAGLRLNIKKTKIMAWQIEGEKVKVVTDFFFSGSKITAHGYCSHEIERQLLLGRKVMTNLDSWKAETLLCWQRSI